MFGRSKGERSHRRMRQTSPPIPGTEQPDRAELPRPNGPWDIDDIDEAAVTEDDPNLVDLGGLLVRGRPGLEMRLQVDERDQAVVAVLLVSEEGAVEMRAFAAPRNESIWSDVRREIGAETTRRGGTATEQEGEFGTELQLVVPVQNPDGQHAQQVSRVVGVSAPRWLLRGTFLGRPAQQPDPQGVLESAFREVVVRRGDGPMAPRNPIPLQMPPGAEPGEAPAGPEQA
ncbi:MAG: DUF3710 domain-containing protein [Nocardioidaceae bacterium]